MLTDKPLCLCSLFGFIFLHMLMYAINIFYWRKYRVNYAFIFGFKPGTELGYRQVLLVSFGLGALALASVLANLDMEMDPKTKDYKAFTELVPLKLVVVRYHLFNINIYIYILVPFIFQQQLLTHILLLCCSLYLSSCSCHSTSCIDQVDSSSSHVCSIVYALLYTR